MRLGPFWPAERDFGERGEWEEGELFKQTQVSDYHCEGQNA